MLFNSIEFAIFLPVVFLLYWFVFDYALKRSRYQLTLQNAFVVLASYVFYGWWDWRFLLLIALTSLCSWGSGLLIGKADTKNKAKAWMWANIVLNVGILAMFKYYDFFVVEFAKLFHVSSEGLLLKVILPVGISFYTFQALSYSIDVYRKKIGTHEGYCGVLRFHIVFPSVGGRPYRESHKLVAAVSAKAQVRLRYGCGRHAPDTMGLVQEDSCSRQLCRSTKCFPPTRNKMAAHCCFRLYYSLSRYTVIFRDIPT